MDAKQACRVCRSLLACLHEIDDSPLLTRVKRWRAATDTPIFPCLINPGLRALLSITGSNSANEPTIYIIILPAGVVVSIDSVRLRKPALRSTMRSIKVNRARDECDNQSSFQAATTPPLRSCESSLGSSGRSQRPPEAFS